MWFKSHKEHADLIMPAEKGKRLVNEHYKEKRILTKTRFSCLHYRYLMTFEQISSEAKLPESPSNMRALESDFDGFPLAFHELSLNKANPELLAIKLNERILLNFKETILKIAEKELDQSTGEIRHLSIPAVNIEAVWYKNAEESKNEFYLTSQDDNKIEAFSEDEFIKQVKRLKNRLVKMDNNDSDNKEDPESGKEGEQKNKEKKPKRNKKGG